MNKSTRIEVLIRNFASIPAAIFCLAVLGVFVSIGYRSIYGPILGAVLGAIAAILLLHIRQPQKTILTTSPPDFRIPVIMTSLYIVSVFTIYRFVNYEQPPIHYIVFGGFAGYIAYEIATGARKRRVIPQLLALTFFTYWSVQLAFPAAMSQADTRSDYLPAIRDALTDGTIDTLFLYLGHLVYATESILITGLSAETGYFILANLILAGTVLVISILDLVLPSLSQRVCLYAALFFGCMSWTLGRGFHPSKLSFFYALTLLLGMVAIVQYKDPSQRQRNRWLILGSFVSIALLFGHQFSAGAAFIFLVGIGGYTILSLTLPTNIGSQLYPRPAIIFTIAYGIALVGNPIHTGPLLGRLTGVFTSIFLPEGTGSGGGGPGRYSELPTEILLASTSSEMILFGLGILGTAIAIRRVEWEYDLTIFWMGFLSMFLAMSLVFNAADTQPQRFYSLLGLFGLNIFAGVALTYLVQSDIVWFTPKAVGLVIFIFAVMSLASPIASFHLSMVSDDVPHNRLHETDQLNAGTDWANSFEGNSETMLRTRPKFTDLPYERDSGVTAIVNTSKIRPGYRYVYTETANNTGILDDGGLGLGDRVYVFLKLDRQPEHNVIYSNEDTTVFQKPKTIYNKPT